MIDLKTLYELGIPRLPELTGPAMKAANKAVSNGAKPAAVKALVSTLAHSASPTEEPMGELKQLFMPLAKLLAKAERSTRFIRSVKPPRPGNPGRRATWRMRRSSRWQTRAASPSRSGAL